MYVVMGANGRAGGETARALIEQGHSVRVVVRRAEQGNSWKALGAEVAIADLDDVSSIASALKGASGAFVLNPTPPGGDPFARTKHVGSALADAAKLAGLPKLVALSSIGAQHAEKTGIIATLHQFETLLDEAAAAVLFLRSAYFIETWSDVVEVAQSGALPTFIPPDQNIPMVSTFDVGRTAANLLAENWTGKRVVEVSGPSDYSANDVARTFAQVLNRPIDTTYVPPAERAALLASEGVDFQVGKALLGMYEAIEAGRFQRAGHVEQRTGTFSMQAAIARILELHGATAGPQ